MLLLPLRAGAIDRAVEQARQFISRLVFKPDQDDVAQQKGPPELDLVDGPPNPIRSYLVHTDTLLLDERGSGISGECGLGGQDPAWSGPAWIMVRASLPGEAPRSELTHRLWD